MIREQDPDHFEVVATVPTERGARTMAADGSTGRIYLATADFGPPVAGQRRPPVVPGSFRIVVVGRVARRPPAADLGSGKQTGGVTPHLCQGQQTGVTPGSPRRPYAPASKPRPTASGRPCAPCEPCEPWRPRRASPWPLPASEVAWVLATCRSRVHRDFHQFGPGLHQHGVLPATILVLEFRLAVGLCRRGTS